MVSKICQIQFVLLSKMSPYRLGELLITLSEQRVAPSTTTATPRMTLSDTLAEADLLSDSANTFSKVYYEEPSGEQDILNLARSLFDLKEYRKCAHLL